MADADILLAAGRARAQGAPQPAVAPLPQKIPPGRIGGDGDRAKLPNDAPYPKDFIQLYNKGIEGFNKQKPGERADPFWQSHLSALDAQKTVYDKLNSRGDLKNLPENVRQYIGAHPDFKEWQPQPAEGREAGEGPQPQNPQIGDIKRLFGQGIQQNAPTSAGAIPNPMLRQLMQKYADFAPGQSI